MFRARPGLKAAAWARLQRAWASEISSPSPSPRPRLEAPGPGFLGLQIFWFGNISWGTYYHHSLLSQTTMSDPEKGKVEHKGSESALATDPSDEAASKLWAVYISEAEKYDKSLVESWKSDMEGMLIFAGLFSASLTAFLIESYKTLSPDSGDQTVKILAQISQQLASGFNGTAFPISAAPTFTPSSTSLVCNALWFISLGLSLTCALIATLLEQWARDFIHRADMRSAPLIRARIYSYLYYGMKRFNMHVVVDVIPLLLHASLLLFFAGLVAFLIPVNIIMAAITAILLFLVAMAYSILTFLPLLYTDCPYRTPLSGAFWRFFQHLRVIWTHHLSPANEAMSETDPPHDETMMEVIVRTAMEDSPARRKRDYHALVWTVKSLADETELEPFVDALPEVLWRPYRPRDVYSGHVRRLVDHRDVQLCARIDGLYTSCTNGILLPEANTRRRMSCYKALWAVASLARPVSTQNPDSELPVDFHKCPIYPRRALWERDGQQDLRHYAISAQALMKWSTFRAIEAGLEDHGKYLTHCLSGSPHNLEPPPIPIISFLRFVTSGCGVYSEGDGILYDPEFRPSADCRSTRTSSQNMKLLELVERIRNITPHSILMEYIINSADLDAAPYRAGETLATLSQAVDRSIPFTAFENLLFGTLEYVLNRDCSTLGPELSWFDTLMTELCSLWKPADPGVIPSAIIHYLNHRGSDSAVSEFLLQNGICDYVWRCVRPTLYFTEANLLSPHGKQNDMQDLISALWTFAFWDCSRKPLRHYTITSHMDTLDAMSCLESFVTIIALLKLGILLDCSMSWQGGAKIPGECLDALLSHGIFPPDAERSGDRSYSRGDVVEAVLHLLTGFLENCTAAELPYKAVETLGKILTAIYRVGPSTPIQNVHQIRFATSVHGIVVGTGGRALTSAIVRSHLLDWYGGLGDKDLDHAWITAPTARQTLTDAFTTYKSNLSADSDSPQDLLDRLRAILHGLETLHPDPDPDSELAAVTVEADGPEAMQPRREYPHTME
ncbi:hypothetical protein DFH06DRAFT_1297191 [Mycena polygramma]|nr:hypothetical protein DFH06DRAFT_1297191 [Mycena polygramma]